LKNGQFYRPHLKGLIGHRVRMRDHGKKLPMRGSARQEAKGALPAAGNSLSQGQATQRRAKPIKQARPEPSNHMAPGTGTAVKL